MKRFSPSGQHYPDPSMPPENAPEVTEGQPLTTESKKVKTNQSFESLFDSESLCDVILSVNDGQFVFRGHKMILGLKSEILATMLNELHSSESQSRPVLSLKEAPECSMVFSRFLYFIYSGAVWLHRDYVLPLHSLAEKYQVKPLIQHCHSYISQILFNMIDISDGCRGFSLDIICDIYEGNLYSDEICDLCYKVLCAKFRDLSTSERWPLCSWHLVSDLLKCDDCNAEENVILTSATEWMKKNQLADKNLIEDILVNIRYPLLHRKVLYHLQKNGVFKNFPQVQELVENAVRYHCFKDVPEARDDFVGIQFTKRTIYRTRPNSVENNRMNSPETLSSSSQNLSRSVQSQTHCSPAAQPGSNETLLEIQTRTTQAINANETAINATVFQAFAVKEKNGGIAQVEVNLAKTGLVVYADRVDITRQFYSSDTYSYYVASRLLLKRTGTNSAKILFPSGITFDMSLNLGMLELTTGIPGSLSSTTNNSGLLGNINGNMNDDLKTPNGTLLPSSTTEKEIYFNFGELWRIDCAKSLFVYGSNLDCNSFKQTGFSPIFMDDFTQQEINQAQEVCGGPQNFNCIYDFLATQNEAIANATKKAYETSVEEEKRAENAKPFLDGVGTLYTVVGQSFNITAFAYDVNRDNVTIIMLSPVNVTSDTLPGNVSFSYIYTPADMTPYAVELYAIDELNGVSIMLSETVYQCYDCNNHGNCNYSLATSTSISSFFIVPCSCDIGWTGDSCETDIDGCAGSPCDPLSNCTDTPAAQQQLTGRAFTCQNCPTGYQMTQSYKCIDIDECSNSSLNLCNQLCTNTEGSYSCSCHTGYRLTNSLCSDINECQEGTNACQQQCVNTAGSYSCSCVGGYSLQPDGVSCTLLAPQQTCADMNCSQGCSVNATGSANCFCNQGYTLLSDGRNCTDVNECENSGQCSQVCSNTDGGFTCSCFIGYKLQKDKFSCLGCDSLHWGYNCNTSCDCSQNALRCDSVRGCVCKAGWSGVQCNTNINECVDPSLCSATEVCVDNMGSYSCQCITGYRRSAAGSCQNVDECSESLDNCTSTEYCQDVPGSFLCPCKTGYQRNTTSGICIDVDECLEEISSCSQNCHNTIGSYFCTCLVGYQLQDDRISCVKSSNPCLGSSVDGTCDTTHGGCTVNASNAAYCFCDSGYELQVNASGFSLCPNINECERNISGCSHVCTDISGSFSCSCPDGYKLTTNQKTCESCSVTNSWGPNCTTPCNCGVGASSCDPIVGCVCQQGWNGTLCDTNINECLTSPCNASQVCVDNPGSYTCTCSSGFQSDQNGGCQDVDECSNGQAICQQLCINTEGSYNCSCRPGFSLQPDNISCQDIDECTTSIHNCSQGCSNLVGSYLCYCNQGYELDSDRKTCNLIPTTTTQSTTTTPSTTTTKSTTTVPTTTTTKSTTTVPTTTTTQSTITVPTTTTTQSTTTVPTTTTTQSTTTVPTTTTTQVTSSTPKISTTMRVLSGSSTTIMTAGTPTTQPTIERKLLPFGSSFGDSLASTGDDSLQAVVYNQIGFMCGCSISRRIYIYSDGFISADARFDEGKPTLLSDSSGALADKILAPYWTDIDLSSQSRIWYQLYQDNRAQNVGAIFTDAKELVVNGIRGQGGDGEPFNPNSVLIVTWENVVPSPKSLFPTKNATFQLLVVSDGVTTYTGFLYDSVHWDTTRPAVMGFRCGNQPSDVYSHPASLSKEIHSSLVNQGYNRHNTSGVWIYRLDTCSETENNYRALCYTWMRTDSVLEQSEVNRADSLLPACPCNTVQAALDDKFVQTVMESNCYFVHPSPVNTNYTRKCCYSSYGSLLFATLGSGYVFLNSPLTHPREALVTDLNPYTQCCVQARMCEEFFIHRPSDNCNNYIPVSPDAVSPMISYYPLRLFATVGEMVDITSIAQTTGNNYVSLIVSGTISANVTERGMSAMLYRWTPRDVSPKSIQIYAQTPNSMVSSTVTPDIILCPGCSGHGRCYFDNVIPNPQSSSFFLVECVCELGWTGPRCSVDEDGCVGSPCNTTAACQDLTPSVQQSRGLAYQCSSCSVGYTLSSSLKCIDVDECGLNPSPCSQGCLNTDGSYLCTCQTGYRLDGFKCVDVDECNGRTSGCEQSCVNTQGSYHCVCSPGYQLHTDKHTCLKVSSEAACIAKQCPQGCRLKPSGEAECFCSLGYRTRPDSSCEEINECLDGVCPHTCKNTNGSVECGCYVGYSLQADRTSCKECNFDRWGLDCNMSCDCTHHSLYCDNVIGCVCKPGWVGRYCELDTNECEDSGLCQSPEVCTNTLGSYRCDCENGYQRNKTTGLCEYHSPCSSWVRNTCRLDEECIDTPGGYTCVCGAGFRRVNGTCEDLDECSEMIHGCHHDCVNTEGSYRCSCKVGYSLQLNGKTCLAQALNPCRSTPQWNFCDHNYGGCTVDVGDNPVCFCRTGYSSVQKDNFTLCNDIQECWMGVSGCSHGCENTWGGFTCTCPPGYTLDTDRKICKSCSDLGRWGVDCVNSCECGPGALKCDPVSGCVCKTGWTGPQCTQHGIDCTSTPCATHQKCVHVNFTKMCVCENGYQRDSNNQCQDIDECSTGQNLCTQRCVNTPGGYQCTCLSGFQLSADNKTCIDEDECELQISDCHQKCLNTIGGFYCVCYEGFHLSGSNKCIKDEVSSQCVGVADTCQYGCRVEGGRAFCYCPLGYTLNPDQTTCTYVNSTVNVQFVTEIDFKSEYNNPSSLQYKSLKKDIQIQFGNIFNSMKDLSSVQIIKISENCTIFDVQVKFKTNLTSELDASLTTAVESVRQSGVQFQGQKYAITDTPVISVPYVPAPCILCLASEKCYITVNQKYTCRTLQVRTTNVVPLKITIQRSYEGYMADTVDIRYARLEDSALRALSGLLNLTVVEKIQLTAIIPMSTGTQIQASIFLTTSGSSGLLDQIGGRLHEIIDKLGCVSLESDCVSLLKSSLIFNGTQEVPVPCYTCTQSERCKTNAQGLSSCIALTSTIPPPTTTQTTVVLSTLRTGSTDTQILVGVGVAVPIGVLFFVLTIVLSVLLCKKRHQWKIQREMSMNSTDGRQGMNRVNRDRVVFRQPILPIRPPSAQVRPTVRSGVPPSYPRLYPVLDHLQDERRSRISSRNKDEFALQRPLVDQRPSNIYQN